MAGRKSVPLRIHPRLYEALRRWAEDDFRSVNGQIEWLCHEALVRAGRLRRSELVDPQPGPPPSGDDVGVGGVGDGDASGADPDGDPSDSSGP